MFQVSRPVICDYIVIQKRKKNFSLNLLPKQPTKQPQNLGCRMGVGEGVAGEGGPGEGGGGNEEKAGNHLIKLNHPGNKGLQLGLETSYLSQDDLLSRNSTDL